jgi:uncharacterized protein
MKKMKFLCLALALLLIAGLAIGCKQDATPTGPWRLTMASGWVTGVYYPISGAMSRIAYEKMPNISLSVESSGASVANAKLIGSKDADLAIIQNDIAFYAVNGQLMFDKEKIANMTGLFMLHPEPCQLVVTADSGINSPADLKGKRVAVGPLGSGTEANALQIVEAYGLTFSDFSATERLAAGEAADFLKDGRIDAAFFTTGLGAAAIADLALVKDVKLVAIDNTHAKKLADKYPFYTTVKVPANLYRGIPETQTVTVVAMVVARKDLPTDVMYTFVKAIYENLETIHTSHAMGRTVTLDRALDGMPIDLHPGATQYFKEVGKIK